MTSDQVEIKIAGVSQGLFDAKSIAAASHPLSFTNLGTGPHVLELRHYRGEATMDAFITPATGPATAPFERLRGEWRLQLLVRAAQGGLVRQVVREALGEKPHAGLAVDVDPFHLM